MNTKIRELTLQRVVTAIARHVTKDLDKLVNEASLGSSANDGLGLQQSCLSCVHFRESTEICNAYNARPPARIIAFGCDAYCDTDDIPF